MIGQSDDDENSIGEGSLSNNFYLIVVMQGEPAGPTTFRAVHLQKWHAIFPSKAGRLGLFDLMKFSELIEAMSDNQDLFSTGLPHEVDPDEVDDEEQEPIIESVDEKRAAFERSAATWGNWFDPDDGLAVVRAMIQQCDNAPKKVAAHPAGAGIREDLSTLEAALLEAKYRGKRFRFRRRSS